MNSANHPNKCTHHIHYSKNTWKIYFLFWRGCAQCAPSSIYLWSHIKGTWSSLLCLYQPTSFVEHQHEAFCRFCLCCDYLSFIYGSKCKLNFRFSITRGQSINTNGSHKCGKLRMYDSSRQFIGLGEITKDGRVSPKRLINIT